jgi:GNAT superfamily N-acetyltransferase
MQEFQNVVSVSVSSYNTTSGIRPVNLRTDLAPLADLIELVFADSMDNSGRAALREMRMMSHFGAGLNVLSRLNEMSLGINMGYVWIEDERLVGNVSIYPAHWHSDLGSAWIIANVGVHPDYQRRGIARQLMRASMDMIQSRGGDHAILQVDYDNDKARNLYRQLGFIEERAWSLWRRPAGSRLPLLPELENVHISHRRRAEWRSEYELAQRVRPAILGGLGWLRPLHTSFFRPNLFQWFNNTLNLKSLERLVIRSRDEREILAALWVESGFGSSARLTLLVDPKNAELYGETLMSTAVRRFGAEPLVIEHPYDETLTNTILERYRFHRQRTVVHMRWDAH